MGRPWDEHAEATLIGDALQQVELADRLGYQYVWEVEHHFLEEYSHSSAPEVFLGACSQRTANIRLGHGIVLTAPRFNHPARVAERVSMLDLVSGGRVEFGSGESSSEAELGGFQVDPARKRQAWLEGLETALRCMLETPFTGVDGEFVQMPPRNVIPKPVQRPHPPLWLACSRRDTILLAASKGMGALTFAFIDPEEARTWVHEYEQVLANECIPVGWHVNPQVACVSPMMVHDDEHEAIRRGAEGANFFGYSLGHYYVFGTHRPGVTDVWSEYEQRRAAQGFDPEAVAAAGAQPLGRLGAEGAGWRSDRQGARRRWGAGAQPPGRFGAEGAGWRSDRQGARRRWGAGAQPPGELGAKVAAGDSKGLRGCIGTPDQARQYLRRYEAAGVDQVIFVLQAGRNRHEDIMESLELFGRQVLPEFAERDERLVREKAKRLAPVVDEALARKEQTYEARRLGDYHFAAIPRQWADTGGSEEMAEWLQRFADDRAAGRRDPGAGIAG